MKESLPLSPTDRDRNVTWSNYYSAGEYKKVPVEVPGNRDSSRLHPWQSCPAESACPKGNLPGISQAEIPERGAVRRGGLPGDAGVASATHMIYTSTPKLASSLPPKGRPFNRRCRRLYSRVSLGLCLPGRYYFLTLTSSPRSPPLEKTWNNLRQWLKTAVPGVCWCYCFTNEGHGVIHMVLRIHAHVKNLDVRALRRYWEKTHGAKQIRIVRVKHGEDLASYLANQKRKNRMAKEMGYQSGVTRWRWSKGWIPKGFTKEFGRIWVRTQALTLGERLKMVSDCINQAHEKQKREVKL